jgi:hypothetical protein
MPRKPDVPTKTISLTGDHVHMPVDLLTPDWENCANTQRYEGKVPDEATGKMVRAKYEVHGELADFLVDRDQAMVVEAPPKVEPAKTE